MVRGEICCAETLETSGLKGLLGSTESKCTWAENDFTLHLYQKQLLILQQLHSHALQPGSKASLLEEQSTSGIRWEQTGRRLLLRSNTHLTSLHEQHPNAP